MFLLQFLQVLFKITDWFFLCFGCFRVEGKSDSSSCQEFSRLYIQFLMEIKLLNDEHVHFHEHKEYVNTVLKHKLDTSSKSPSSIILLIHRRFYELRVGMIQHFQQLLLLNHPILRDSLYFFRAGEAHCPFKKRAECEWTYYPVQMFKRPHFFGMVAFDFEANDADYK